MQQAKQAAKTSSDVSCGPSPIPTILHSWLAAPRVNVHVTLAVPSSIEPAKAALEPGLYIVATPIGNLGDITLRAADVLGRVSLIACEDSRVTSKLLRHLGIRKRLIAYHDHSTEADRERLLETIRHEPVALVSDAGTPLISDPGFKLVRAVREAGIPVTTLPGACAAIAGLTLSGLPTDRFLFIGFLPSKTHARKLALQSLDNVPATLVFYESGPRLVATLEDMAEHLSDREIAVAREITKLHEECRTGSAASLAEHYRQHPPKGEIVLMAGPRAAVAAPLLGDAEIDALLIAALEELSASSAAAQVAKSHGLDRRSLYIRATELSAGRRKR